MLYLITGANGAGKTLNTLKWIQERALKEGRPVCHNGRFEPVPGGEIANWKQAEFKDWQAEPDGTIFLVDECHNDLPVRAPSSTPPEYVRMLAEHRRRGFDFYLVTQHPQNIDSFVRRLIGSPGWHRHLKRTFGADMVSVLEWNAVNPNCEKDGAGKSGSVTMKPFPKEVYGWYKSASLHTGKKKIPRAVYTLAVCALAVPVLFYFGGRSMYDRTVKTAAPAAEAKPSPARPDVVAQMSAQGLKIGVGEYLDLRKPRLADFPHTAPAYDEVTKPSVAPYPAACVQMKGECKCYTQQATIMQVSYSACVQIVTRGFFVDWRQDSPKAQDSQQQQPPASQKMVGTPLLPVPVAQNEITQFDLDRANRPRNTPLGGMPSTASLF